MKRALPIAILAAMAAALGMAFAHVVDSTVETSPITPPRSAITPIPTQAPSLASHIAGRAPATFSETTARPLFWATRRPIVVTPVAAVEPIVERHEQAASGLRLAGIIHEGDSRRRALLVWPGQPAGQWLDEGAALEGWRLLRVERFAVQVSAGNRIERLDLH